MKIAYIVNPSAPGADRLAPEVRKILETGSEVCLLLWDNGLSPHDAEKLAFCDAAVVLGGDGTIMHVAKAAGAFGLPVLGINGGHMGFLAGLEADQIEKLSCLFEREITVQPRMMLSVTLHTARAEQSLTAFNEAVISRGSLSKMIRLSVFSDAKPVCTYRADGVILATPTGSTAYSLSAGGPVADPALRCILLTPICPHAMHTRPFIFSDTASISVRTAGEAYLTVDGEEAIRLGSEDWVTVRRHPQTAQLISLKEQDAFYDILTQKLIDRR